MNLVAKTFHGLEHVLANELAELGARDIKVLKRAVSFGASKELLYKSNLHLRTALRILQPLTTFSATTPEELYRKAKSFNWSFFLKPDQTIAIDTVAYSRFFNHSGFISLKVKDAICDQFREQFGQRPSVNLKNPTLLINVHVAEEKFTISLDSSGEPLNRRGYRTKWHPAPVNEVLAAGMILLTGWDGTTQFLDPMCGSGTFLIEAAMIATRVPPGLNRKEFGFTRWNNFDKALWEKIVEQARANLKAIDCHISGSDIDPDAIDAARQCALDAGLKQHINLAVKPFNDITPRFKPGVIIMNPPYDERMKNRDIYNLYSGIGTKLKHQFTGWDAWVISSNLEAMKAIGLKPTEKHLLYNGSLECRFMKFSIHQGSIKASRENLNPGNTGNKPGG